MAYEFPVCRMMEDEEQERIQREDFDADTRIAPDSDEDEGFRQESYFEDMRKGEQSE